MKRVEIASASAGEIVAIAGIENAMIGDTIANLESPEALPVTIIEEPTDRDAFHGEQISLCRHRREMGHVAQYQ